MRGVNWVLHTRIQIECLLCVSSNCDSLNFFLFMKLIVWCSCVIVAVVEVVLAEIVVVFVKMMMMLKWLVLGFCFQRNFQWLTYWLTDWLTFIRISKNLKKNKQNERNGKKNGQFLFEIVIFSFYYSQFSVFLDSIILANKNVQYVFVSFIF